MDHPFESPAVLSICPGVLGLERGLARAGVHCRVMAYVEIEAFIIANLVAGMESGVLDPAPIWTDAKTFDAQPFRGKIHGIIGGYPCPGESLAGLREGHLYKGFIWSAIRRAIAAARPLWCFFENVDDHLTGTYPIVQRSLRTMGYAVEAGIFSAEEAGSSQERKRIFILAILANAGSERLQRHECSKQDRRNGKETAGSTAKCRPKVGKWPAGQGYYQHDWEPSRTLKPGMGCRIDGYNFHGDLLRAIGNSVVEQTAEIAFIDLLKKHRNNYSR